ncbi:putative membrane protein, partial [Sideroxydans sp. CL21]
AQTHPHHMCGTQLLAVFSARNMDVARLFLAAPAMGQDRTAYGRHLAAGKRYCTCVAARHFAALQPVAGCQDHRPAVLYRHRCVCAEIRQIEAHPAPCLAGGTTGVLLHRGRGRDAQPGTLACSI